MKLIRRVSRTRDAQLSNLASLAWLLIDMLTEKIMTSTYLYMRKTGKVTFLSATNIWASKPITYAFKAKLLLIQR